MAQTPNITLNVTLLDIYGDPAGTPTVSAFVRIALCGYGQNLPGIPGTGNLAKVVSWFADVPVFASAVSIDLWGNDQINPPGTFYSISVLDGDKNVVQTDDYIFTGTQIIDLSNAVPIAPGGGSPVPAGLVCLSLEGTVPGTVFSFPTLIFNNQVIALYFRGVLQRPASDPGSPSTVDWTYNPATQLVTLNFTAEVAPYALYVQAVNY